MLAWWRYVDSVKHKEQEIKLIQLLEIQPDVNHHLIMVIPDSYHGSETHHNEFLSDYFTYH